jgi:putative ABC transport system permease protein
VQARARLTLLGRRLEQQHPETNAGRSLGLEPLGKYYAPSPARASQGLVLMLGAVGLVLLIACAHVANLLARAATRRRECVVRAALGASRGRLVRQLLIESTLLFVIGGGLGVLVASASSSSLSALALAGGYLPERMEVAVDMRVLAAALFVTLLTALAFGLAPAFQAAKVDLREGLHESSRSSSGPRGGRGRRVLVAAELSLALVLMVGFGLLIRSFLRVQSTSGGFDAACLLEADAEGGRSFRSAIAFWSEALATARAIPDVSGVALTSRPPVHGSRRQGFQIDGQPPTPPDEDAGDVLVSADYFETMGIPLLRGRAFTERDDETSPPVVIVSQAFARRHFPGLDPLGRRLRLNERSPLSCCSAAGPVEGVWREIVGVVGDVRQANLDEAPARTLYRPYTQIVEHDMFLMVRTRIAASQQRVAALLHSRLVASSAERGWSEFRSMQDVIRESESMRLRRFVLMLLGSFAGVALSLAAVGTYGVTACSVAERTRELGVRLAFGATRRRLFGHVLGETLRLALLGVAMGWLAAVALTRLLSAMLFGIGSTDALTYAGVSLLLGVVVLVAAYVPALQAARVDPITALRHE